MEAAPPRYREFIAYVFGWFEEHAGLESHWSSGREFRSPEELTRLFESAMRRSGRDLERYSDQAIGNGIWLLFGEPFQLAHEICEVDLGPGYLSPTQAGVDRARSMIDCFLSRRADWPAEHS